MDLSLSKEQELVRDTMRQFSKRHVAPDAARRDREHAFPKEVFEHLQPLGFLGALIPPEYGGAGLDKVSYCLALEEIAYGCASTSVSVAVHTSVAVTPILWFGSAQQKERFLPALASGKTLGAFAVTEAGAGSDVAAIQTKAVREGRDYVLTGEKVFITNASVAGQYIVAAKTGGKDPHDAISVFVVDRGAKGVSVGKPEEKLGLRASDTASVSLDGVRVEEVCRIGAEGQGFRILMKVLNSSRLAIAAQAVGIGRRALDESIAYATTRKQFGVPIARHQAIQGYLADMATRLDAARLLTYQAASDEDHGQLRPERAAMAKLFASEFVEWATTKAVQIHGGNGYLRDYPVERLMRDARVTRIYEGTSEIQRGIIGKALMRT